MLVVLITWLKCYSPGFSTVKLLLLPLWFLTNLWEYTLRLSLLFLISLSFTGLIWWCVFPEKWLLWCKMVIFLIPSFLLHLLALYYYLWTHGTMLHSVSYNPLLLLNVLVLKLCQISEVQAPSIWPVYLHYGTLSQNGLSDSLL